MIYKISMLCHILAMTIDRRHKIIAYTHEKLTFRFLIQQVAMIPVIIPELKIHYARESVFLNDRNTFV